MSNSSTTHAVGFCRTDEAYILHACTCLLITSKYCLFGGLEYAKLTKLTKPFA